MRLAALDVAASSADAVRAESTSSCSASSRAGRLGGGRLLEHDVRVRAADAERADAGAARRALRALPRPQAALTKNGVPSRSSFGFGALKWRLGGKRLVLERERRLDQPGDAGGRVEVADVALDRADRAEAASRSRPPARNAWVSAAISIGSPSGVPVPCASTYEIVSRVDPARAPAPCAMTSAWPSTLGAVKLDLATRRRC